jgi:AraC-like DNA-binding protein
LQAFNDEYQFYIDKEKSTDAIIKMGKNPLVLHFIQSLTPYFNDQGKMEADFHNIKRKELLLILLKEKPDLKNILFDFGKPEKIDLQAFMNRNYKFNVTLERFAYLTGRSLSAFKREFQQTFNDTPGSWLMEKRLREAHFQITKKEKKPSDIYLDLGFEDLSHFSFAFKKLFGHAPSTLKKDGH